MTPEQLKDLGYPSNIIDLITETEGVDLIEENNDYYIIHDNYNEEDRVLQINKSPSFKKNYFEFFDNEIDKELIYNFAKTLPSILFMNLMKVYFVEKEEDLLGEIDEKSPNHTFHFSTKNEPIGMAVYRDSVAIVNLRGLKKIAKEEAEDDIRVLGYTKGWEFHFMEGLYQTLSHELFHLTQFNPLIEELIPVGEVAAEEFCRNYSED